MRNFLASGAFVLLAGCAVGPDYEAPVTPEPEAFHADHQAGAFSDSEQRFWAGFGDPLLAQLIEQTLAANQDLQVAVARYDRAAALLYGAKREQWPSVTASASGAEQYLAEVERTPAGGPERVELYQAGVNANWELDLFGRLRRATESRQAELSATAADIGALQVALVGQVASSYFELRGLQQRLAVAEQNVGPAGGYPGHCDFPGGGGARHRVRPGTCPCPVGTHPGCPAQPGGRHPCRHASHCGAHRSAAGVPDCHPGAGAVRCRTACR